MNISDYSVRRAVFGDIAPLAQLFDAYRQFYAQRPNIELATAFIGERIQRQESVIFVVESAQTIIGFCQLYPTFCSVEAAPIMVLYDLFVSQVARKGGAGRALMLAAQAYATQNGFVRLDLSTAKTNLNAQTLYESLGWERDTTFFHYSLAIDDTKKH